MEKMKIDVGKLTYIPSEFDTRLSYPLPIGIFKRSEIEVFGQLRRTGEVDWRFDNANIEFSVGFPRIHLRGEGYVETYPYREFLEKSEMNKKHNWSTLQIIRKYGRSFLLAVTFYEIEDLSKREEKIAFKKKVFEEIKDRPPEVRQGHLSGHFFWKNEIPEGLSLSGKRFKILNHEFHCRKPFQWFDCDHNGDYFAVLRCPEGEYIYVVSPDHLNSPRLLSPGNYCFTHPEPGPGDDD